MKNIGKLTIITLAVLFMGCQPKGAQDEVATDTAVVQNADNEAVAGNKKDVDFGEFFAQFKSDASFQKKHIKFPLLCTSEEAGDSHIEASEWGFSNFSDDEEVEYSVEQKEFSAIVSMKGKECGIAVDYIFSYKDGEWMMEKISDWSN